MSKRQLECVLGLNNDLRWPTDGQNSVWPFPDKYGTKSTDPERMEGLVGFRGKSGRRTPTALPEVLDNYVRSDKPKLTKLAFWFKTRLTLVLAADFVIWLLKKMNWLEFWATTPKTAHMTSNSKIQVVKMHCGVWERAVAPSVAAATNQAPAHPQRPGTWLAAAARSNGAFPHPLCTFPNFMVRLCDMHPPFIAHKLAKTFFFALRTSLQRLWSEFIALECTYSSVYSAGPQAVPQ